MNRVTDGTSETQLTRRDVIKTGLATTAGVALSTTLLAGCMNDKIREKPAKIITGKVNIGPARQYPAGTVSLAYMEAHGIAIANDSDTVIAIRPVCTHAGCAAPWHEELNKFVCPCHRSTFNLLGLVLTGPARKPLPEVIAQKNDDGTLTVDLDKLYAIAIPTAK